MLTAKALGQGRNKMSVVREAEAAAHTVWSVFRLGIGI
jgi:hypothetical protein